MIDAQGDPRDSMLGVLSYECLGNGRTHVIFRQTLGCNAYVSFEPDVILPDILPCGWFGSNNVIFCDWEPDDNPLVCMQNVYDAMYSLTKWAESLPDVSLLQD